MNKLQSILEFGRLAFEVGAVVLDRINQGDETIRVSDILPEKYRDREKLRALEAAARADYPDDDPPTTRHGRPRVIPRGL
jgi:hypothetical protein